MPHSLLELLRYSLLAAIWLFFIYAARMVWVEVRRSRVEQPQAPAAAPVAGDKSLVLRLRVVDPPQRRGRVSSWVTKSPSVVAGFCGTPRRRHIRLLHSCPLFRRSGELWIEDLGSTNGTFLNDERLETPTRLRRGDRVKVGSTRSSRSPDELAADGSRDPHRLPAGHQSGRRLGNERPGSRRRRYGGSSRR